MRKARLVWGAVVGTIVAVMFGAMFDYARIAFNISTDNLVLVYPWVAGIGGLAAAVLTAIIGATGAAVDSSRAPAKKGAAGKSAGKDVPGMPSFDFDKARSEAAKSGTTTSTSGGSRPEAPLVKPPQEPQK